MNPAHGGLGYLAYVTGATVVPIAIDTFFNISAQDFFLRRRKVTLTICKPISASKIISSQIKNPAVSDFRAGAQMVMDTINEVMK